MLEEEAQEGKKEKMKYMEENCPTLSIPQSTQELQVNVQHQTSQTWEVLSQSFSISHIKVWQIRFDQL